MWKVWALVGIEKRLRVHTIEQFTRRMSLINNLHYNFQAGIVALLELPVVREWLLSGTLLFLSVAAA